MISSPLQAMDFNCVACRRSFDSLAKLRQHCNALSHFYPCTHPNCHRSFKDQDALQQHLESKEHTHKCHKCHKCNKKFSSPPALRNHLNSSAHASNNNGNKSNKAIQPAQASHRDVSLPSEADPSYHRPPRGFPNPLLHISPPMQGAPCKSRPSKQSSGTRQTQQKDMKTLASNLMPKNSVQQGHEKEGSAGKVLEASNLQSQTTETSAISKQLCILGGYNDPNYGRAQNIDNVSSSSPYKIMHQRNFWSIILPSSCADMFVALAKRCHSLEDLRKHNYILSLDGTDTCQRLQSRLKEFIPTPPRSSQSGKCHAIALDCEMVGVEGSVSELVLISAVDFITGEVVMNTLVCPQEKVVDWRSRISGVTPLTIALASTYGQILNGWKEARAELWRHIDADTILVGQALQHDLNVLRMIHSRVVDTAILVGEAVGVGVRRTWGLKALCKELLDIEIQNHGSGGHDCLEDAFAAREVAIWCIQNVHQLSVWGRVANKMEREKQEAQRKRRASKKKKEKPNRSVRAAYATSESDDLQMLRWEDIAEDLGWPHPDTGYDPWSD